MNEISLDQRLRKFRQVQLLGNGLANDFSEYLHYPGFLQHSRPFQIFFLPHFVHFVFYLSQLPRGYFKLEISDNL